MATEDGTATQVTWTPGITGVSHWKPGLHQDHSPASVPWRAPPPPEPRLLTCEVARRCVETTGYGEEYVRTRWHRAHLARGLCPGNGCNARGQLWPRGYAPSQAEQTQRFCGRELGRKAVPAWARPGKGLMLEHRSLRQDGQHRAWDRPCAGKASRRGSRVHPGVGGWRFFCSCPTFHD